MLGKLFVTMMIFAVVMMVSISFIMVMGAALGFVPQLAVKICCDHRFHRCAGFAGADGNALLRKKGDGTLANTAHDNHACPLLANPGREKPGCMWWRYHRPGVKDFLLFGVRLHKRELSAAAKVSVKPAFGCGNCDGNHVCFFPFVGADGAVATRISWLHPLNRLVLQPLRRNKRLNSAKPCFRRG